MFEGQTDRLDAFITQMRQHKQIKTGNGTQSIMNLIKGTTNCIRLDYIGTTMNIIIDDENGDLDKYAVGEGTNNGEVMLVFDNLIKNAHEAKALTMRFQAQANIVKNDNTITLYVGDNGTGIRDRRTGELLINTELIFNPGFSTKENSAKITIVDKILGLERLHKEDTLRGNGLYYSRERLRNAGGDITVFSNSIAGTIFELKIPIKPKRKGS
jgi:sensor histidine kinase regulating citrate/malate metabolism